jgi:hypothetical protein
MTMRERMECRSRHGTGLLIHQVARDGKGAEAAPGAGRRSTQAELDVLVGIEPDLMRD